MAKCTTLIEDLRAAIELPFSDLARADIKRLFRRAAAQIDRDVDEIEWLNKGNREWQSVATRDGDRVKALRVIGDQMANVMYNWAQNTDKFTEHERDMMNGLRVAWDAIKNQPH